MTNGEKLIKEHPEFIAHYFVETCDFYGECEDCPLHNLADCSDEKEIVKWFRSEVKSDEEQSS